VLNVGVRIHTFFDNAYKAGGAITNLNENTQTYHQVQCKVFT